MTARDKLDIVEKLRCVIQRLQCSDVVDLQRLLVRAQVDIDQAWLMFEAKAGVKNIDPAEFAERFDIREPQYRKQWGRDLAYLGPIVAGTEQTLRELRRVLRDRL